MREFNADALYHDNPVNSPTRGEEYSTFEDQLQGLTLSAAAAKLNTESQPEIETRGFVSSTDRILMTGY